jgi:hypothetical protein
MANIAGRVAKDVCRSTPTSSCDMRDKNGSCCNNTSAGRNEAKNTGSRVCDFTVKETGISAGDSTTSFNVSNQNGNNRSSQQSIGSSSYYAGGGAGEYSVHSRPSVNAVHRGCDHR